MNISIKEIMLAVKTPQQLGLVLRTTRTALNLPAADVAHMAGTNAVSLRRLEEGRATRALSTLFALLDELGLELHVALPPQVELLELPPSPTAKPRRTRVRP